MKLLLQRLESFQLTTPGDLFIDGTAFCKTLEDQIRETDQPVSQWKVKGETAIPAGIYELEIVDSPKHGLNTIRLKNVEGFDCVDIHSGVTNASTEGCILVGDQLHMLEMPPRISGGLNHQILAKLKAIVLPAIMGEGATLEVRNP